MAESLNRTAEPRQFSRWRRTAATVGPVLLVGLLGALTLVGQKRERFRADWVGHTQKVMLLLEHTLASVRDAETSQRGFLLVGDSVYLRPFFSATNSLHPLLDSLRQLTVDNPPQHERVRTLTALADRRMAVLQSAIEQHQRGNLDAALQIIRSGRGLVVMDSIRAITQALEDEETRLLARRTAAADRTARLMAIGVLLGTLLAAGLALLINVLLSSFAVAQETSARKLAEQNDLLQSQAVELELMNDQLAGQAAELESQTEQLQQNATELELQRDELQEAADELIQRTEVAEEANRAKMSFLRAMSHELRTPLNAIGGYAELLELGIRGPLTEAQRQDLGRIIGSQRHLLSLINDILNFAKLEAGRVHFEIRPCPVHEILAAIEPLVRPQIEMKGLTYQCSANGNEVAVEADPEKVRQIMLNLLSNAIKFTPPGGRIAVDVTSGAESVGIHVRDTGIGIPLDRLGSIFEPFVQAHRTLSESTEGTGLGLAISRELARGMLGDLTVISEPNQGSHFALELPRAVIVNR